MIRKIKRLLGLNIIEWVKNTKKDFPTLESDEYLLVENVIEGPMMFTKHQVKIAKDRAKNQQEDL